MVGLVFSTVALSCVFGGPLLKRDDNSVFDYGKDKLRGVNLGGWFILEPFINPSLFNEGFDSSHLPVDEYHLTQAWGKDKASKVLDSHWDSWISEDDFAQISSWGLNAVRIPIGYWALVQRDEDPYVQGQLKYLDRALGWARKHNIKAWIDLHGVPGSQNGFDNSGQRDVYDWQNEQYPQNIQQSYEALEKISNKYATESYYDVVAGIELVNEPLGSILDMDKLHDYYNKGYQKVRSQGIQNVIVHDAFKPAGYYADWLQPEDGYWNVVLDHHEYQVFDIGQLKLSTDEHVQAACELGRNFTTETLNGVVGEWSAAMTDCAPLLNGVYKGARYDGTFDGTAGVGSCDGVNDVNTWSDESKQNVRKFAEAQMDAWEQRSGWFYWTYKTENTIEWDLHSLISHGIFPQPVTDRQYGNQCGF